jgi:hypothetical protein
MSTHAISGGQRVGAFKPRQVHPDQRGGREVESGFFQGFTAAGPGWASAGVRN